MKEAEQTLLDGIVDIQHEFISRRRTEALWAKEIADEKKKHAQNVAKIKDMAASYFTVAEAIERCRVESLENPNAVYIVMDDRSGPMVLLDTAWTEKLPQEQKEAELYVAFCNGNDITKNYIPEPEPDSDEGEEENQIPDFSFDKG